MNGEQPVQPWDDRRLLAITAWVVVLAVSDLPDIVWNALAGRVPTPLFWAKCAFLAVFLGLFLELAILAWPSMKNPAS